MQLLGCIRKNSSWVSFFAGALALGQALTGTAHAQDRPYISVGQAKTKKSVIAFPEVRTDAASSDTARTLHSVVSTDLAFMDLFRFLDSKAFIEKPGAGIQTGTFQLSDWSSIGAEFVIKTQLARTDQALTLEAYLYDTAGAKQVLAKRYVAAPGDSRTLAHTLANDVVLALTGLPGIFQTKLVVACAKGGKKELYLMDFDGTNAKQLTKHRSIAFSPAWSPDGTRLAYSLFTKRRDNVKNIDLFELDFHTNTIRLLSNRKGINSGSAYSPDGRSIALTMSFLGNPEIFTLDPTTSQVTRLTKSFGFDVDPSWSPDGKKVAFVSSRSGNPMVFSMNADGSNVQRLTYAGRYNASPSWSPRGNKIAFAGWLDGHFDIFIMNPDGSNIERLTQNQGNNEDPAISPDGNFVAFTSNRTGGQNIYVMNLDGTFVKRLTFGLGNCSAPKWSNPPNRQ